MIGGLSSDDWVVGRSKINRKIKSRGKRVSAGHDQSVPTGGEETKSAFRASKLTSLSLASPVFPSASFLSSPTRQLVAWRGGP